MRKKIKWHKTTINRNESYEGETIEEKIFRMINNGEEVGEPTTPITFTERKDGVIPTYNIRHDKWETVQEAMSRVGDVYEAKRAKNIEDREALKNLTTEETQEVGD